MAASSASAEMWTVSASIVRLARLETADEIVEP